MSIGGTNAAREPFLPLFFGDFLSATAEWDGEEQALYLLLLGYQWSKGSVPAEPRRICKLARWEWALFERCWPQVEQKFPLMANAMPEDSERHGSANGGRRQNVRLEEHRARAASLSAKNSDAGKKGASVRWGKKHGAPIADAIETDSERHKSANGDTHGATDSNPIQSNPFLREEEERARAKPLEGESESDVPRGTIRVVLDDVPSQLLAALKEIHPSGTYRQAAWLLAEREIRTCLEEGATAEEMYEGDKRYALQAQATGSVGTQFVIGPDRFFRERMFREPFPLPSEEKRAKGPTAEQIEQEAMQRLKDRRADMAAIRDFRDPNPGETSDDYRRAQNAEWAAKQPRDIRGVTSQLAKAKAFA